jgi:hypothetical protein
MKCDQRRRPHELVLHDSVAYGAELSLDRRWSARRSGKQAGVPVRAGVGFIVSGFYVSDRIGTGKEVDGVYGRRTGTDRDGTFEPGTMGISQLYADLILLRGLKGVILVAWNEEPRLRTSLSQVFVPGRC